MPQFYSTADIGPNQSWSPEGFLICRDVRIGRTGEQLYADGEIEDVDPGPDGLIRIQRSEEDVFADDTIDSFTGKPITDDHPPDGRITPDNYQRLSVGEVHNVRREGSFLVADLFVKERRAIDAVRKGKREVSCGYSADYEQLAPGYGRQRNIIGNHVALVDAGRCGPACRIEDHIMQTQEAKVMASKMQWKSFADKVVAAFRSRDENALDEVLASGHEMAGGNQPEGVGADININFNPGTTHGPKGGGTPGGGGSTSDETAEEKAAREAKEKEGKMNGDAVKKLTDSIGRIDKRLGAIEKHLATDQENPFAKKKDEGEEEEEEKKEQTEDSASLELAFKDVLARAELLAPGIRLPTFDAKLSRLQTLDRLCAFRRRTLTDAFEDAYMRSTIEPFLDGESIKQLSCDGVKMAFVGASEAAKRANNSRLGTERVTRDQSKVVVPTIAEMNKRNREFWNQNKVNG